MRSRNTVRVGTCSARLWRCGEVPYPGARPPRQCCQMFRRPRRAFRRFPLFSRSDARAHVSYQAIGGVGGARAITRAPLFPQFSRRNARHVTDGLLAFEIFFLENLLETVSDSGAQPDRRRRDPFNALHVRTRNPCFPDSRYLYCNARDLLSTRSFREGFIRRPWRTHGGERVWKDRLLSR